MSICLPFDDLVAVSTVHLGTLASVASQIDSKSEQSCLVFASLVEGLEEVLRQTYQAAAKSAREADNSADTASVWEKMGVFADGVLNGLFSLKEVYIDCGTPELYDLALDYKLACQRRYADSQEEAACQNENRIPAGLFPAMT